MDGNVKSNIAAAIAIIAAILVDVTIWLVVESSSDDVIRTTSELELYGMSELKEQQADFTLHTEYNRFCTCTHFRGMIIEAAVTEDAEVIMHLVNAAYQVETGDSGCGFKTGNRFKHPFDSGMQDAYDEGRVLKVIDEKSKLLVGMARWRVNGAMLYFGPIAVHPDHQGKGIATQLLGELRRIAEKHSLQGFEICVVNHRSDLLPWYKRLDFVVTGEEPFTGEDIIRPSIMIHMEKRF